MSKFDDYELTWYEKDDLEELDELADKLYWEAVGLNNKATLLENKSRSIRRYLDLIGK